MILLLVIGALLGGLGFLAVGFGIPIKDTTFGNAILLSGMMMLCSSLVIVGLAMVARELKGLSRAIAQGALRAVPRGQPARPPGAPRPAPQPIADQQNTPPLAAEPASVAPAGSAAPPPWAAEAAARDRVRAAPTTQPAAPAPPPEEPAPAPPPPERPRRNLLFATRRRDREQSTDGTPGTDQTTPSELPPMAPPVLPPTPALEAEPRASFESAWPSRGGDTFGRRSRAAEPPAVPAPPPPDAPGETVAVPAPPSPPSADAPPPVTVIKSGVVDGMAYSLYSDGSIEAQMPEGMLRFASLDELRSHLDQRP
jgi:hypothetical protein